MRRVALLFLALAACQKPVDTMMMEPDAAVGSDGNISGNLTADMTWSGAIHIVGATTLSGTVTVEAGTTIDIAQGVNVKVQRQMVMNGTSAAKIVIKPASSRLD